MSSADRARLAGVRSASAALNRNRLVAAARKAFAEEGYAAASMDELTASAGLTRGALYHAFGDKKGLLAAVIAQLDGEMAERLRRAREEASDPWEGLLAEGVAYIGAALDPEIQRIMLLDGPAVLGDPSSWPGEQACLETTMRTLEGLRDSGLLRAVNVEAAARLINGAAFTAALWVAASDQPGEVLDAAIRVFCLMVEGLLLGQTR